MNIKGLQSKEIFPGLKGKFIHGKNISWVFWNVSAGAKVPMHSHEHEQIMYVLEGKFKLKVNGKGKIYEKDDYVVIPSNAKHEGEALSDCKLMDVFSPARDDYR
ncbi:MAG: cupin [Flavobacteriaceae bacterium]|nr:cupin [Flavobacteriaceae bacterium]